MNVPFLPEDTIEAETEALLLAYGLEQGRALKPPIPVEDILEQHLGLSLDFDDLRSVLGVDDVIGTLWVDTREVFIDQSLDPSSSPDSKGRYNFTIGHEIAHWQLHRGYFLRDAAQATVWPKIHSAPSVVCRSSRAKDRIEWQADRFAASLLMPKAMVGAAWRAAYDSLQPRVCDEVLLRGLRKSGERGSDEEVGTIFFDFIASDFAPIFGVSVQAMRIRLETLRLLLREAQPASKFSTV